jgi:hypothetical protein
MLSTIVRLALTGSVLLLASGLHCGCSGPIGDVPEPEYDPETDNVERDMTGVDAGEELGTLEQPIYIEGNYGFEVDGTKCSPPWSGGTCGVPDIRQFSIGVHQYTCPTQLFKDQILDAANHARDVANANGWSIEVHTYTTGPEPGHNFDLSDPFDIRCTTSGANVPAGRAGRSDCSENIDHILDCHDTQFGQLCQYRNCNVFVRNDFITNSSGWAVATNAQRGIVVENVGRHEMGHALGFGHSTATDDLMFSSISLNAPLTNDWTGLQTYTTTEKHQLDCYRETSGTTTNCP